MLLVIIVWQSIFRMVFGLAKTVLILFHIYVRFLKQIARLLLAHHVPKQHVLHVNHIVKFHALLAGYITQHLDFVIR